MEQETLEEAAERFYSTEDTKRDCNFIEGAKWQQEQDKKMYSEDEILNLMYYIRCNAIENEYGWQINGENLTDKELLKQFKKNKI